MTDKDLRLYSKSEAAKLMGIGRTTLNQLILDGKLGTININNRQKISRAEIERFLQESVVRESEKRIQVSVEDYRRKSSRAKSSEKETISKENFQQLISEVQNGEHLS